MVAIFTGSGLGLEKGSGNILGARGQLGSASLGRANENVFVNAANGNLVINHQDEFLIGRGPDSVIDRTYNSQGQFTDDNGDNWALGIQRRLHSWSATPNVAGATVTRMGVDGTDIVYTFDVAKGAYYAKDGSGAYDKLINIGHWVWTDGDSQTAETYDIDGNLINSVDTDGNGISYQYTWYNSAWRLSRVTTADGNFTDMVWSGNNLIMLTTTYTDTQSGTNKNLLRTRYAYDGSNRLTTVWTDLSPEDNSITDGRVYTTSYTYHGTSKLVATISQTDGSQLSFTYDGSGRVATFTQAVEAGVTRTTSFSYGSGTTTITDPQGNVTELGYDAKGQLFRVTAPVAESGGKSQITEYIYNANGDLIETIEGIRSPNLLDTSGWAGEQRGANLVNLSGWPSDPNNLPSGQATVAGWANPGWTIDEARWIKTQGPDGQPAAVIQVGQTDTGADGGGNYTNTFAIDKNRAYEFVTYFQVTELNKHRVYFGLDGTASVVNATDGAVNTNPYFSHPYPDAASGLKAGNWYKVVGYVLPSSSGNLANAGDLGGIYDVGSGERISDVQNFRWNESQPAGATGGVRFFNYYDEAKQGYFTNYYKPEVRELNLAGGNATVGGWYNGWATEEARWAATKGPDGKSVFAIQSGQTNPNQNGGGNYSSEVQIDRNKAYEFTYYFKLSSLDKHYVYSGLNGSIPVENLATGASDGNPYFYHPAPGNQGDKFVPDRWYKVVGYVLPQGSSAVPADQLGGVYDTTTGNKIDSIYNNYRWSSTGTGTTMGVRFFNYYGDVNFGYSTYFYKPEIREASRYGVTSSGLSSYVAEQIINRQFFKYDDNGNLIEQVDQLGNTVRWSYGAKNEMLTETRFVIPDADGINFASQPTGAMTTRYVYDGENHLRFIVSAEGRVTQFNYDVVGNQTLSVVYVGNIYTGSTATETDLNNWVGGISDKSNIERTDTTYDFRGNVATVTSWSAADSAGNGTGDYTRTTYTYDQYGNLLSKLANDGGQAETYAYDGMGRTIRFTDAKGVGTWTSYIDAQNRTITTLASGLTKTGVYNKAGELIASTEARGGISTNPPIATDLSQWGQSGLVAATAGSVDGAPATKLSVASGYSNGAAWTYTPAVAGEMVTYTVSLQAVGNIGTQGFGLWGGSSGWGSEQNYVSARIISGPGTINYYGGYAGLWQITGLSNSEATRVEITRIVTQDEYIYPHIYVQLSGGVAGDALLVSGSSIVKTRYDASGTAAFSNGQFDINNWGYGGVTRTAAAAIGGAPAATYTIDQTGQWSGVSTGYYGESGDTISAGVSLQAVGSGNSASFGIYGSNDSWGYGFESTSTARIVSGLGTLTQEVGGLWNITGLSSSTPTRIEISRTLTQAESGGIYLYPERPNGWIAGRSIIAGAPSVTRTPGSQTSYRYDSLGRLRIKIDQVGTKNFYFYDNAGRKVADVDGDGSVTEYKYDAADRITSSVAYATALSAAQIASLFDGYTNPTSVTFASIRPAATGADRWAWNVYDKAGRLIETIDAAGAVQHLEYDGAGRLIAETRFYSTLSAGTVEGFKTSPPTALILPSRDDGNDRMTRSYYDNDGLLVGSLDEDGYLSEHVYDKTGRKVETIRYAVVAGSDLQHSLQPGFWRTATLAQLKVVATTSPAADIHNYTLYDGRGFVGAVIDGEGNITRYHYTARGDVDQEVRGQQVSANTLYTLASLPAASGTLETTTYQYDARRQVTLRQKALWGGNYENTFYAYDSMGNLTAETTNETLSSETRTHSFRYDAKGRLIGSLDGNGSAALAVLGANPTTAQVDSVYATYGTRFVYDAADRLIQKITPDGSGATGNKTVYYYDSDGQLRYEINALGEVSEYRYNVQEDKTDAIAYGTRIAASTVSTLTGGLVTATISNAVAAIANSVVDSRTYSEYDNRGQLRFSYSPLHFTEQSIGHYSDYSYNAFGEFGSGSNVVGAGLTRDIHTSGFLRRGLHAGDWQALNGSGTGARQNSYSYDAFGRLSAEYTNNTDWRYSQANIYDRSSRLTASHNTFVQYQYFVYDTRSNLISSTDRTGKSTTFAYDLFNRNVTTTTAEGVVSTIKRNAYGQTISITDGAGRTTAYTYDKNGNLKTVTDAAGTVTSNYDNADRLIETIDGRGVRTTYGYDAVGRVLTEIRDTGGLNVTTTYAYDAKGQQLSVTDALGSITNFSYDLKGQKTRTVQDAGGLNIITDYAYRADGKVISMTEGVGTSAARTTTYVYDSMGRLTESHVDPLGLNLTTKYAYDVNNNVVAITDARNFTTRFVYDRENRQILSVSAGGEVIETGYDGEGRTIWTRGYANRIAASTVDGFALEVAEATVRANLSADAARDRITRTFYDGDGRRAYAVDGEGYATRFKYDGANNIIKTVVYASAGNFSNASTTASNDGYFGSIDSPPASAAVTSFAYDGANRLTSTTDAEGYTESYILDANGNRTWVTNKLGGATQYGYDNLGRLAWERTLQNVYRTDGTLQASETTTSYIRDALGNVLHQVEAYGLTEQRSTSFEYDKLSRLTKKTLPQIQQYDPPSGGDTLVTPVETYQYDARGNLILVTDPAGAKTYFYYDSDNRKVATITAVGQYQSWTYDGNGHVLTERTWATLVSLPASAGGGMPGVPGGEYRETLFVYDRNGRLGERRIAGIRTGAWNGSAYVSNAGQTLVVTSIYDAFGNMVQEIDANGNSAYHYYDRNGRETAKVDQEKYLTAWYRDEDGNVIEERRFANIVGSGYDQSSTREGLIGATGSNANDRTTIFTYDKNGRRLTESRQSVAASTISSNSVSTSSQNANISYAYNGLGEVTQKTEANGDNILYAYDTQGRLTWQRDAGIADYGGGTAYHRTSMFYDALGNVVRSVEQGVDANGNYASGYGSAADRVTRYEYGPGGRLRKSTDATGIATSYQYDIRGNLRRQNTEHSRSSGEYLSTNQFTDYDIMGRAISQVTHNYHGNTGWQWTMPQTTTAYNAYGEVASKSTGGVVQEQFQYDLAGRVIKSNAGDGVWKFFAYDAGGNATLTLVSNGASDESATAYDAAINSVVGNGTLGSFGQTWFNATVALYDKRGLQTGTYEPGRTIANAANLATNTVQTLTNSRSYNAYGEVLTETDARGNLPGAPSGDWTTYYTYNVLGKLTQKLGAYVNVTSESGAISFVRPVENYAYDISGRLVGLQSANGYWTTRNLLAGTGHDNPDEALVTSEYRADGSVWSTGYNIFGNARWINGGGRITNQGFDLAGRLTISTKPSGLTEYYAYDGLGQRIRHWNSYYGGGVVETTDYDAMGRVTSAKNYAGDETTTSYAWNSALVTSGLGTFGGWVKTTSTIADRYSSGDVVVAATETSDSFGRMIARSDMGAYRYEMTFNKAGQLVSELKRSQYNNILVQATTNSYYNTGQLATISVGQTPTTSADWSRFLTTANYDAGGKRVYERLEKQVGDYTEGHQIWLAPGEPDWVEATYSEYSVLYQDGRASYDALGRMATYTDLNASGVSNVNIAYEYDADGNIRHMAAAYKAVNANGSLGTSDTLQDYWYKYDALDRMVTTKGSFTGARGSGYISRATVGTDIAYNGAGERGTATTGGTAKLESYSYNGAGQLANVTIKIGAGATVTRATYGRDLLGRVSDYAEYNGSGVLTHQRYQVGYNNRDQVLSEKAAVKQGSDWIYSHAVNYYTETGQAASAPAITASGQVGTSGGSVLYYTETKFWKNGSASPVYGYSTATYSQADKDYADSYVTNGYIWADGAVQSTVNYNNRDGNTYASYSYDSGGALTYVGQTGGTRPRNITFVNDAGGKVLERTEVDNKPTLSDPRQRYYRFGGTDMGSIGNDGTDNVDYDAAITQRNVTPGTGAFRGGATTGSAYADFDQSYDGVNPANEASVGSYYSVRSGDSLQSIAQAMWGDASLWYMLAEANGLSGSAQLAPGQGLIVPEKGSNFHNNADTFRPYDAARAIGDTQPGAAKPPKAKCAVLGAILMAVVAIAVVIASQGTLTGFAAGALGLGSGTAATVVGGALAAAAGSAASQAYGNVTGIQKGFSFKGVALAALGGGIGGGLSGLNMFGAAATSGSSTSIANAVVRGALSSAAIQGVGVATGLQKKFSWTAVAAAGVSAGVMEGAGAALGATPFLDNSDNAIAGANSAANHLAHLGASMAGALAGAGTRSIIDGSDFGDNITASLPDVISQTVGNMMAHGIGAGGGAVKRDPISITREQLGAGENKPIIEALEKQGAEFVIEKNGNVAVKNYERAKFMLSSTSSVSSSDSAKLSWGSDGLIMSDAEGQQFIETAPRAIDGVDLGGLNIRTQKGNQSFTSDWFGMETVPGVLRIITTEAGSALYLGGSQAIAALGISIDYGPRSLGLSTPSFDFSVSDKSVRYDGWGGKWSAGSHGVTGPGFSISSRGIYTRGLNGSNFNISKSGINGTDAFGVRYSINKSGISVGGSNGFAVTKKGIFAGGYGLTSDGIVNAAERGVVAADGLIYRRIDTTGKIEPYFGQTTLGNQAAREAAHNRAFPNSNFRYFTVDKGLQRGTALDIAEHNAIQDFTGGVAARRSSAVSNLRDPVGAARRPALGLPEPK